MEAVLRAICQALSNAFALAAALPLGVLDGLTGGMRSPGMPKPVRKAGEALDERRQARLARRYARAVRDGKLTPDVSRLDWRFSAVVSGLDQSTAPLVAETKTSKMVAAVKRLGEAAEAAEAKPKRNTCPSRKASRLASAPRRFQRERPKSKPRPEPVVELYTNDLDDEPEPSGPRL